MTRASTPGRCWPDAAGGVSDTISTWSPSTATATLSAGLVELVCGALLVLGRRTEWAAAVLLLFLVPVTVLMENPLRADANFGTVIDFLKNRATMRVAGRPRRGRTRGRQEASPCKLVKGTGRF